jgi:hypothetical protein
MEWGCHPRDLSHDQRGSEPGTALLDTSPPMASSPMASLAPADPLRPRRHGTCRPAADTMTPSPVGLGGFRPPPDSVPCSTNTNQMNGWAHPPLLRRLLQRLRPLPLLSCSTCGSAAHVPGPAQIRRPREQPLTPAADCRWEPATTTTAARSPIFGPLQPAPYTWARTAVTSITTTSPRPGTC